MSRAGVANAIAAGLNGYIRGMQIKQGMDRNEAEDKFRADERDRIAAKGMREDDERRQLQEAYRPVEVQEGAGGALKPDTMDNRDVGLPGEQQPVAGGYRVAGRDFQDRAAADAAAVVANSPDAANDRAAQTYRRLGKPAEAAQLESATVQAKAAKFTLDKGQQEWVDQKFDQRLSTITNGDDLAGVLSGSPLVAGRKVTAAPSTDGKTIDLIAHNDDGSTVKVSSQPIENTPGGFKKAMLAYSQGMKPTEKIAALQHIEQFDEQKRQFEETKRIQQEQFAETKKLQQAQLNISQGHLGVAQEGLKLQKDKQTADLKNNPEYVLPAAVKMTVNQHDRVISGIEKTINDAEAKGEWDPKGEGAKSLRVRLAKAYEARDALIAPYLPAAAKPPAAGGDYMGYKGGQSAPGAQPAKPPVKLAPIVGPSGGQPTLSMPPRDAAPAAPVDPMAAQAAQESTLLNQGKIQDFSPEVKQYRARLAAEREAQAQAEADAYRQRELQRAQAASRTFAR